MLGFGDFVVLLHFNAISRTIENALRMEGIPNQMLGGHQFFERAEIKDTLAYLQLVDNPHFEPAFSHAINIPPRGIGDKVTTDYNHLLSLRLIHLLTNVYYRVMTESFDLFYGHFGHNTAPDLFLKKAFDELDASGRDGHFVA
ncbi:UvrD-like helicase C-terminal domain-containing protein [Suillus tomentosus]|nr:UvrD-like helicase C-terminal domain-containing protein [Suillus tomentosus]